MHCKATPLPLTYAETTNISAGPPAADKRSTKRRSPPAEAASAAAPAPKRVQVTPPQFDPHAKQAPKQWCPPSAYMAARASQRPSEAAIAAADSRPPVPLSRPVAVLLRLAQHAARCEDPGQAAAPAPPSPARLAQAAPTLGVRPMPARCSPPPASTTPPPAGASLAGAGGVPGSVAGPAQATRSPAVPCRAAATAPLSAQCSETEALFRRDYIASRRQPDALTQRLVFGQLADRDLQAGCRLLQDSLAAGLQVHQAIFVRLVQACRSRGEPILLLQLFAHYVQQGGETVALLQPLA